MPSRWNSRRTAAAPPQKADQFQEQSITMSEATNVQEGRTDEIFTSGQQIRIERNLLLQNQLNTQFGYEPDVRTCKQQFTDLCRDSFKCSRAKLIANIYTFLPILQWLPRYDKSDVVPDLVAGLTVGIMHIPQGMAYADLAGLDPVYGLYTSFFPSLVYVFFGTSRHISLGTFAVASLMVGQVRYRYCPDHHGHPDSFTTTLAPDINSSLMMAVINNATNATDVLLPKCIDPSLTPIAVVCSLTFLVGIIQVVFGICRLGIISLYLSDQLVGGFTTGAAIMVFTAQVNKVFGVKLKPYSGPGKLYFIYRDLLLSLPKTNIATLIMSIICIIIIFVVKEWFNPWFKKKTKLPFPIDLIVLIVATAISYLVNFEDKYEMKIVNHIPTGLPHPFVPRLDIMGDLVGDAISLAIIVFTISVSMAKIFAKRHRYKIDPNQEWIALSLMHIISSFFECHPGSASLTRSIVAEDMGQRTQEFYAHGIVQIVGSLFDGYVGGASLSRSSVNEGAGSKSQEFYAIGLTEMWVSLFGSFVCSGTLARSTVNEAAGATSQLSGLYACGVVLVVLLWIGPLFESLPKCVLAAIIMVALKGMFMQLKELKTLWPVSKIDFSIWLVSFLATTLLDVTFGLLVSIGYTLLTVVCRAQWANSSSLGRLVDTEIFVSKKRFPATEDYDLIKVYHFNGPLFYANSEFFRAKLLKRCDIDEDLLIHFKEIQENKSKKSSLPGPCLRIKRERQQKRSERSNNNVVVEGLNNTMPKTQNTNSKPDDVKLSHAFSQYPIQGPDLPEATDEYCKSDTMHEASDSFALQLKKVPRFIIVDLSVMTYIDVMGIEMLKQVYKELGEIGCQVLYANIVESAKCSLKAGSFDKDVPESNIFATCIDAYTHAVRAVGQPSDCPGEQYDTDRDLTMEPLLTE